MSYSGLPGSAGGCISGLEGLTEGADLQALFAEGRCKLQLFSPPLFPPFLSTTQCTATEGGVRNEGTPG